MNRSLLTGAITGFIIAVAIPASFTISSAAYTFNNFEEIANARRYVNNQFKWSIPIALISGLVTVIGCSIAGTQEVERRKLNGELVELSPDEKELLEAANNLGTKEKLEILLLAERAKGDDIGLEPIMRILTETIKEVGNNGSSKFENVGVKK